MSSGAPVDLMKSIHLSSAGRECRNGIPKCHWSVMKAFPLNTQQKNKEQFVRIIPFVMIYSALGERSRIHSLSNDVDDTRAIVWPTSEVVVFFRPLIDLRSVALR